MPKVKLCKEKMFLMAVKTQVKGVIKMLKLIHKIYRVDKVTIDIIKALTAKITSSENKINDLYKQIFLNYATWYLDLKENEMAITKLSDDISKRRNVIKMRLLGVGTATKAMLESTVNSIDGVITSIGFENMTVIVTFIYAENNKLITFALDTLKEIMPYHLDLFFTYEHIKWQELKNVTWADVKKYTWKDITDSVEGTVEKGLNPEF